MRCVAECYNGRVAPATKLAGDKKLAGVPSKCLIVVFLHGIPGFMPTVLPVVTDAPRKEL